VELFYRKYGEGNPVLILHGLFGMSDNWVSIAKKLGENYEVFVPDLRNHGQSPHSDIFDYDSMTNDILEFIEYHNIRNPFLIGHSMGGKVVMKLALENMDLPAGIIIVDISPNFYSEHPEHVDLINAMQSIDISAAKSFSDIDKQLAGYPISLKLRQFLLKNLHRTKDNSFVWKFNIEAIKLNLDKIMEGINTGNKSAYPGPALFIKGGQSDYIKPEDFAVIKKMFPASEIITIDSSSHWVHADTPLEFMETVQLFIGSLVH
jgi:esterase